MIDIIDEADKDPLGTMMLDYLNGSKDVFVEVDSTTLDMWTMKGETTFRSHSEMAEMERIALQLCKGKILDAGAEGLEATACICRTMIWRWMPWTFLQGASK